jgi:hypothetical protein
MQDEWLPGLKKRGILDGQAVERLWHEVSSGSTDGKAEAEALWVAVGLEVWAGKVLSAESRV